MEEPGCPGKDRSSHLMDSGGRTRPVLESIEKILARLAARDEARSEATVQADVRSLLLNAPLELGESDLEDVVLESPVGERRRIDVETGMTVFEVKKDLR